MARIGIDARPLCKEQSSGITRYVLSLINALQRLDQTNDYVLYAHKQLNADITTNTRWRLRTGTGRLWGNIWIHLQLPRWLVEDKIDIFWGTQHVLPLMAPKRVRLVLTIHDVVYKVYPRTMSWINYMIHSIFLPLSLKRAHAGVCDTQWTLQDLGRFFPIPQNLWRTIHLGVNANIRPIPRDETLKDRLVKNWSLQRPYILTVATFEPRKNLETLLKAFCQVSWKIPHDLVLVGPRGWKNADLSRIIRESNLDGRIRMLGFLSDTNLSDVVSGADLFVFPSLYEGFGMPPLEAMALGVPVISSSASCLPEVLGDAAIYVPPLEVDRLASAITTVLSDPGLREDLKSKGLRQASRFTWEKTANAMIDVFKSLQRP